MSNAIRTKQSWLITLMMASILLLPAALVAQKPAPAPVPPGTLTVDRIYGQPNLSGRLNRGISWTPDNRSVTFLDTTGMGKDSKTDLVMIDAATGNRSILVSAEKLDAALPKETGKDSQATGLGRRAPAQFQWAPSGDALLLESSTSLVWFDLKSQTGRPLVTGKAELADPKISPDGKFVSFIRDHNLWLVATADGKERAFTSGGTEEIRKGELDWVYPEELDISTAYWWSPDSASIAYLEMNESKVTQFSMLDFDSFTGEADLQRYPVPGGANPVVHVFVGAVAGGDPRLMDTGSETNIYIPRVNWLPDPNVWPFSGSTGIRMF